MIDELERVRRFQADEPAASDQVREAARAALEQAIARTPPRTRERAKVRPRRRRRVWLLRGAVLAAALLGAVMVIDLSGSGSVTTPPSALAAALTRLANVAAVGPSTVPGPGQYLYVESISDDESDAYAGHDACITHAAQHRQIWIAADGSGLLRETTGPPTFTSAADRATCLHMTPNPLTPASTSDMWFAAHCFMLGPTNDLQSLSTDPRVLLEQMRRIDGGPPGPAEDFIHVGDFLRETDAPPALRAALYRAAAMIPGVRLLGPIRDHLGRPGLGVAYDSHGYRSELIFDPHTSALMGEQTIASSGVVGSWAVYLQSRIVDRLPKTAPVPLTPPCVGGGGYTRQLPSGSVMTGGPGASSVPKGLHPVQR